MADSSDLPSGWNKYQPSPETDGEYLPVVDGDDREIGRATRREIHEKSLMHRAVHVLLISSDRRVLLQKRSPTKDHLPLWWDVSVGGHVNPGEAYIEAAVREIEEEMGVPDAEPHLIAILPARLETGWEHIHVFICRTEPDAIRPLESEVSDVRWVSPEEFLEKATTDEANLDWRVTPGAMTNIRTWFDLGAPIPDQRTPGP